MQDSNKTEAGKLRISVIIPTYNRMNTLPRAIESVLRQSYPNFELIIVDDGSTDNTEEYINSLCDSRVRYHKNQENCGAAESRNIGASLANGEYLAFQDSDDEWLPNKLETVLECLNQEENRDADLIFHQMVEDDGVQRKVITQVPLSDVTKDLYPYMLCFPLVGPPASFIKKDTFMELGGFCKQCKSFEDYELSLRFARDKKVVYLPELLTVVYDSPDSVNKNFHAKIDTELYILKTLFSDYKKYDLLQKKIDLIRNQAVNYDCEEYFYERILDVYDELMDEEAELLLQKLVLVSNLQYGETSDKSVYFRDAADTLLHMAESLKKLQSNIKQQTQVLLQNVSSIKNALEDVIRDSIGYCELTDYPAEQKNKMILLEQQLKNEKGNPQTVKAVLDTLIDESESMLVQICKARFICGKCGQKVKMLPMSPYRRVLRKRFGFLNAHIQFIFENENADVCPVCGAGTIERFLLTFLDDIQPETGEILSIAMADDEQNPNCLSVAVKKYAEGKDYAQYIDAIENNTVDVLICCDLLNSTENPVSRLKKMRDMIKKTGVILLLIPAMKTGDAEDVSPVINDEIYIEKNNENQYIDLKSSIRLFGMENFCRILSERELLKLFSDSGFRYSVIDREWFGDECYRQMAFPDGAKLFMLENNAQNEILEKTQNFFDKLSGCKESIFNLKEELLKDIDYFLQEQSDERLLSVINKLDSARNDGLYMLDSEMVRFYTIFQILMMENSKRGGTPLFSHGLSGHEELMNRYTQCIFALRRIEFFPNQEFAKEGEWLLQQNSISPYAIYTICETELIAKKELIYAVLRERNLL